MKKIILLIAFVAAPILSYGQSLFDKLENMDGVDSIIINKDAFEILSKFNPKGIEGNEFMEIFELIKELETIKVFSSSKKEITPQMEAMVKKAVKSRKLTELMRMKEDNSRALIYTKRSTKDFVSEVLMFVKGIDKKTNGMSEAVIVSLIGNIDTNQLSKIADNFTKKANIKVTID